MSSTRLGEVWRREAPHVLAALVRRSGDLAAAEDAAQDALLVAAKRWPTDGAPEDPRAWLITVGSRLLIDRWRADQARERRELRTALRGPADQLIAPGADVAGTHERDDSILLLVLCCHPALTATSQVALTLRAVAGLTTAQIARAFLVPEPTMAQRISRAKAQLREVGARFGPPTSDELPDHLAAVAHVLYLVFSEGHTASSGAALGDPPLAEEAIRLTRHLHDRLPAVSELTGLLALMLLTESRRTARTTVDGALVPLADQDRRRWDQDLIREGVGLIERSLPVGRVGPYQLQAAVAAVHAEAADAADTDWSQIVALYRMLEAASPSPMITLNHAVAVAHVDGPAAALDMITPLLHDDRLRKSHRLHAVRAHLLEMAGSTDAAREAYVLAARLATNLPEQRYLNGRARRAAAT